MYSVRKNKLTYVQQNEQVYKELLKSLTDSKNFNNSIFNLDNNKIKKILLNQELKSNSGGELQKLLLNKIIIENKDLIILDEPTTYLDIDSINCLKRYLKSIKSNRIIVIITHTDVLDDIAYNIINLK